MAYFFAGAGWRGGLVFGLRGFVHALDFGFGAQLGDQLGLSLANDKVLDLGFHFLEFRRRLDALSSTLMTCQPN